MPSAAQRVVANAPNHRASAATEASITVDVDNVPLATAIRAIGRQAGIEVAYDETLIPATHRVTLHVKNVSAMTAFEAALQGTGLIAQIQTTGDVAIAPESTLAADGIITGTITDAATRRPVSGAAITLDGGKVVARTAEDGTFRIAGVATGAHRLSVRHLGHQAYTTNVTVKDDATTAVSIALSTTATRLNEVVTTAVGSQRRIEVGNSIAHLNVDSIARTAPVSSLTDLLSARVPGLQVVEGSGLVGSGPAIRIRGQSSVALQGDPIVIIDGIRQNNTPGGTLSPFGFGGTAVGSPSRLNDLDFNQIATIDVLKGPAASTEYGTDAANGVIVITTKRGKSGPPAWHLNTERGWSEIPHDFPELYYAYGHTTDSLRSPVECPITPWFGGPSVDAGTCVQDSVTHDNPLNHKSTSIYGHGLRENIDLDVMGGSDAMRYYIAGGRSRDVGTTRTPDVFRPQAIALGFPVSVFDPNTQEQRSARANVFARFGHGLELTVNSAYMMTKAQIPAGLQGLSIPYGPIVLDSANFYGYGGSRATSSPLFGLGQSQSQIATRGTAGLTADWQASTWFSGHVTTGLDHGSLKNQSLFLPQAGEYQGRSPNEGSLSIENATTDISSADVLGSLKLPINNFTQSSTRMGLQIVNTRTQGVTATVSNSLSAANLTLNGAPNPTVTQQRDGAATVGGYVEEQVAFSDRLFFIGAVRLDGASGFGGDYHTTAYPKFSTSWLAYNNGIVNVRVRGAFGAAGQQPANGAALQLYNPTVVYLNGGQTSAALLGSLGNPDLRPERSQEVEGGLDVGLWADRINFEVTQYTKRTKDALVNTAFGWDLNSASVQENIGEVRNSGLEATVQASLVRTRSTTWDVTLNASSNHNKLIRLAPGVNVADFGTGTQRDAVGYPLGGYWGYAAQYRDANHDGVIALDEVTIADSLSYLGSSTPTFEGGFSTHAGFFRGKLAVAALFDYRKGGLIYQSVPINASEYGGFLRAMNDSTAPLRDQAQAVLGGQGLSSAFDYSNGSFVRFRELSVTYAIPPQWIPRIRLQNLRVTAAVRNLKLWTSYGGTDPETRSALYTGKTTQFSSGTTTIDNNVQGDDGGATPLPRTWVLRFNTSF